MGRAHPELEAALTRLNAEIARAPGTADLYLQRGELYAAHEDWVMAEANYLHAAEVAPRLPGLERARGKLALSTGHARDALAHFESALALDARDVEALVFRARARAALQQRAAAAADLAAAVALLPNPRPELFLERAALLDSPAAAITSLDAAMVRVGPVHTLQLRALELEESLSRTENALARLEAIAAQSERQEAWLKRRGDLLARAGRAAEARAAYSAAIAAIAALPSWLRDSPDTARLAAELAKLVSTLS